MVPLRVWPLPHRCFIHNATAAQVIRPQEESTICTAEATEDRAMEGAEGTKPKGDFPSFTTSKGQVPLLHQQSTAADMPA